MKKVSLFYIILFSSIYYPRLLNAKEVIPITNGMIISHSVTIKKTIYKINANHNLNNGIIEIKGNNITVDFDGSELESKTNKNLPDQFYGLAIYIQGGKNITIKNATIKGFKVAIIGKDVDNLTIENCNFSYNFRQHLNSNRRREDLSDWQSYHHNEKDQWLRYGAGIYLRSCDSMLIRNDTVTNGQCGLMMTKCMYGTIYNNNFSFNSGIGIGLYQSSYNKIMNNKLDWNVRGFSYRVYARGQDAAAILMYEQSSNNIIAYNSATHSGDGFFLWAGAYTMKTGLGGCNNNLIYGNDFSYAPTNGVEATFSTNKIINNLVIGCDHGVWGGYSYKTMIIGNTFQNNNTGIAIEQGQNNTIIGNAFIGGRTAIQLWATPGRVMEGNYDKVRDVSSMHYEIQNNFFSKVNTSLNISHSSNIMVENNTLKNPIHFIQLDSSVKKVLIKNNSISNEQNRHTDFGSTFAPAEINGARNVISSIIDSQGRRYIMMTEWGPYDFSYPLFWLINTDSSGKMHFDILGPAGKWVIKSLKGIYNVSSTDGNIPGHFTAFEKANEPISITMAEYSDHEIISPMGKEYSPEKPYIFSYAKEYLPFSWKVKLFSFDSTTDPIAQNSAFKKMWNYSTPIQQTTTKYLDNSYWTEASKPLPNSKIATIAIGKADFPKGDYRIGVSAGDIVRVYIDNKLVINAWDPSKIIYDADYHHDIMIPLEGEHTIRVVQAQYGGYGMLYLTVKPLTREKGR